jgi:hypothetical protein
MPSSIWFWILGLIVVTLLAALGLWLGRTFEIGFGPKGLMFKARGQSAATPANAASDKVSVGNEAIIKGHLGEAVGRDGVTDASPHSAVTGPRVTAVANRMTVAAGASVDRLVGLRQSAAPVRSKQSDP